MVRARRTMWVWREDFELIKKRAEKEDKTLADKLHEIIDHAADAGLV